MRRGLATKGGADLIPELIELDTERRRLVRESEDLKALRNKTTELIGQAKRRGEDAGAEQARMRESAALRAAAQSVAAARGLALQLPAYSPVGPEVSGRQRRGVPRWRELRIVGFPRASREVGAALGPTGRRDRQAPSPSWGSMARLGAPRPAVLDLHTRALPETGRRTLERRDISRRVMPKFEEQLSRPWRPTRAEALPHTHLSRADGAAAGEVPLEVSLPVGTPRSRPVTGARRARAGKDEGRLKSAPVRQGRLRSCDPGPGLFGAGVDGRERGSRAAAPRASVSGG